MTNPCYDFALRPQSNSSNSHFERRHTPQRATSSATPSSQESLDDLDREICRQRGDRGPWNTDGRISIAGGFEDSNTPSCQCHHCGRSCERNSNDFSDRSPPRRAHTARRPSRGNGPDQQQGARRPPPPVHKVDHALWNPMQLLRRPHTSTEREREQEMSRLNNASHNYRSSSRVRSETSSRSKDVRESSSPNSGPHRFSKVRSLRKTPWQQRKLSPWKCPQGRCSSRKSPSLGSRRMFYTDTPTPCTERFDAASQTRRHEFPLTPEETPRASLARKVIASDSCHFDRPSLSAKPLSCAGQRRPSPCKCGTAACSPAPLPDPAAPRGCCCSACVGWQERTQCQKPAVAPQASCQGSRRGNCCVAAGCHQGSNHGIYPRAKPPSVRQSECSKCRQPLHQFIKFNAR